MDNLDKLDKLFRHHVTLYAKGHYLEKVNMLQDLRTIYEKIYGVEDTNRDTEDLRIVQKLGELTYWAYLQLVSEKHLQKGVLAPNDPMKEFITIFEFMFKNRMEIVAIISESSFMDSEIGLEDACRRMLSEQVIRTCLVTIAKVNVDDIELVKPSESILPVREVRKKRE